MVRLSVGLLFLIFHVQGPGEGVAKFASQLFLFFSTIFEFDQSKYFSHDLNLIEVNIFSKRLRFCLQFEEVRGWFFFFFFFDRCNINYYH